jgi:signal transduction histidine kinase
MTLRTRLSLTIAGIALLLVLPAAYSVTQLRQLQELGQLQRQRHGEAYIALGGLQSNLADLTRAATEFTIATGVGLEEERLALIESKRAEMFEALDRARVNVGKLRNANYAESASLASESVDHIGRKTRRVANLLEDDRRDDATTILEEVKALIRSTDPVLAGIGFEIDRTSEADIQKAGDISMRAATTSLAALGLCLVLAIGLGAWTTRALSLPIVRLRNAMAVVADGDFDVPTNLPFERNDEIGSASRSFRAMTLQLADLDRLKAEFLSFATHELRTPLNVVSGYAELLRDGVYGQMSAEQRQALEAIRDQTTVIAQLSNQLLDIGRLEAGGLDLEIRNVSPATLLHRVERAFDPLARQKNIQLGFELDPGVPDHVPVDANRICDQVLGNLVSNALKFTPDGGQVLVRARLSGLELCIDVRDTGPGIPVDKLPQVFRRYYQVGDEARRKGAGLGLSIALAVARAHGGDIEAESASDSGATFRVRLPLHSAVGGTAIATDEREPAAPTA